MQKLVKSERINTEKHNRHTKNNSLFFQYFQHKSCTIEAFCESHFEYN